MAKESPKALAAFHEYCLLGPSRSLAKLAKASSRFGMTTVSVRHLEQWSSAHKWVERAKLYDTEQVAEREQKHLEALLKMDEEHVVIARTAAIKAASLIQKRLDSGDFGNYALVQLLKIATDLHRLALGAATERIEQTGAGGGPLVGFYPVILPEKRDIQEQQNGNGKIVLPEKQVMPDAF